MLAASTVRAASSCSIQTRFPARTGRRNSGFVAAANAGENAGFSRLQRGELLANPDEALKMRARGIGGRAFALLDDRTKRRIRGLRANHRLGALQRELGRREL